jgi:class 3 adenylate cyclase/tetratricopeptide (TPR) repeat protein
MNTAVDEGTAWLEPQRVRRTIVVLDVVESVRLMQQHEADFIDRWRRFVAEVRTQVLPAHGGRLVKSLGDGMLLAFEQALPAVAAALQAQRAVARFNEGRSAAAAILLRAGLHVGDVVVDAMDVYGHDVNLAARLATLATPGQCVISTDLRAELIDGLDVDIEDLGDCYLKNMDQPVRAYTIGEGPALTVKGRAGPVDLRPVIAVLPFVAQGGDDQGVYGEVIADELTVSLSRCAELQVISRMSTAAFKNRATTVIDVGSGLGAQFVVTGSYSVIGLKLRVRIALSEVDGHDVLWADAVDCDGQALLAGREPALQALLDSIAAAVVYREVQLATTLPLPNVQSHALMSAAIALMHRNSRAEFERAHGMLEHLRERHHGMPQPHAWLAQWHVLRVVQGWSADPSHDGQRALDAGHRALDGDPQSSFALTIQGLVHAYLRHDFDRGAQAYAQALAINPNESMAMLLLGTMHAFLGEGEPAWEHTQASLRLSPLDPLRYFYLSLSASAAIAARRYDDAIELAKRSLKCNRMHLSTYRALAIAESLAGRTDEAQQTIRQLLALEPGFTRERFLARFPGRERAPEYTAFLADALERAGLPQ